MLRVLLLVVLPGVAWADKPPREITAIEIDYTWTSFRHNEHHYKLAWNGTQYVVADSKLVVDRRLVDAVVASLTNLRETTGDVRCISHTDDYPHFSITLTGPTPIVLTTDSNCHANVPWNVEMNGKRYSQFDAAIPKAVYPLLVVVDPPSWKGRVDTPTAYVSDGAERVQLAAFDARHSDPAALACVKDLGTNEKVKALFGAPLQARSLRLGCDLGTSAACTEVTAETEALWRGVMLRVELPCNGGVVVPSSANATDIAKLRGFVDSKVMRTLVAQAGADPPRVWSNGQWTVQPGTVDGPTLAWKPGNKTIHVRAMSSAGPGAVGFLKALGIDPAKYTRHKAGDMFWITELDVDFAGKPS